jgi:hypothetical protein
VHRYTNIYQRDGMGTAVILKNFEAKPLAQMWIDWCDDKIGAMGFDATLHLPLHQAHLRSSDELRRSLTHTFNMLDRYFLRTSHRRFNLRIPRFVTHEYAKGVGWHAHISLMLWQDQQGYVIDPERLEKKLRDFWLATTKQPRNGKFSDLIINFKTTHDQFLSYSLKHIDDTRHSKGLVDTFNCAPDALRAA